MFFLRCELTCFLYCSANMQMCMIDKRPQSQFGRPYRAGWFKLLILGMQGLTKMSTPFSSVTCSSLIVISSSTEMGIVLLYCALCTCECQDNMLQSRQTQCTPAQIVFKCFIDTQGILQPSVQTSIPDRVLSPFATVESHLAELLYIK